MILYRIYTEDKNREKIEQYASEFLEGFTILTGVGHWRGRPEQCLIIEVLGSEANRDNVLRIASRIKTRNKQDSVAVTEQEVKTYVIGEKI